MADWEEIKRLAADFQRAQLSSTVQRLSERNCVEIVQKLIEAKLIDVIYTIDGKEYLTPQELGKEIREELQVRGGRVNLVDLQAALNVDFSHVEAKVTEVAKSDKNLTLILGQLIDKSYLDGICEEVNDSLQEQGQVSMAELTKQYDLPGDFLSQTIRDSLGTLIQGRVDDFDPNTIFTQAFVDRFKCKIRGAFSAVTRPINISSVMNLYNIPERLFYSILEELISSKRLAGSISGGRKDKAQYVPDIYTRAQNDWVDSFLKQNGYLEYDSVSRLGIPDMKSFIKKRYKSENLLYLNSCCIGKLIQESVEVQIEESVASTGWCDVMPHVPSILSVSDTSQLLAVLLKGRNSLTVVCDTIVVTDTFINNCSKPFDKLMYSKAEVDARTNPALLSMDKSAKVSGVDHDGGQGKEDKKEQRRKKAATGKSGGGTQGREVKTKSTKKKGGRNKDAANDSDDDTPAPAKSSGQIEFMSIEEITAELTKHNALKECPEDLVEAVAEKIYRPLKRQYQDIAKSVFLQHIGSTSSAARKKTHDDLSDRVNGLWLNVRLFEKGLKLFPDDVQTHLIRHLLKTECTAITNLVFNAVAADHMMSLQDESQITNEVRVNILSKMPEDKMKSTLVKLHASLSEKSLDEFYDQLEKVCGSGKLEILLKKPDKKKERQLVFGQRQAIASQLRDENDPAMTLHLAVTLIFHIHTGCVLHAPGRCVPNVITFLEQHSYVEGEGLATLQQCQELVMADFKAQSSGEDSEESASIRNKLINTLPNVKDIALSAKKASAAASED